MEIYIAETKQNTALSEKAYALLRYALRLRYGESDYDIAKTPAGKPYIVGKSDINISISHTNGFLMCAVSDAPVGVDIQKLRNVKDGVIRRTCDDSELKSLTFFELWSLKESYIKLIGEKKLDYRDIRFSKDVRGEIHCFDPRIFSHVYGNIPNCSCAVCSESPYIPETPIFVLDIADIM